MDQTHLGTGLTEDMGTAGRELEELKLSFNGSGEPHP